MGLATKVELKLGGERLKNVSPSPVLLDEVWGDLLLFSEVFRPCWCFNRFANLPAQTVRTRID
jgi:hypothetical protein